MSRKPFGLSMTGKPAESYGISAGENVFFVNAVEQSSGNALIEKGSLVNSIVETDPVGSTRQLKQTG